MFPSWPRSCLPWSSTHESGNHDDFANACAVAVITALEAEYKRVRWYGVTGSGYVYGEDGITPPPSDFGGGAGFSVNEIAADGMLNEHRRRILRAGAHLGPPQ